MKSPEMFGKNRLIGKLDGVVFALDSCMLGVWFEPALTGLLVRGVGFEPTKAFATGS